MNLDMDKTNRVLEMLRQERIRQFEKWGNQKHHRAIWMLILFEEVGEAAQAILHDLFGGKAKGTFLVEMIHVAAVAVQILESKAGSEWCPHCNHTPCPGEFDASDE